MRKHEDDDDVDYDGVEFWFVWVIISFFFALFSSYHAIVHTFSNKYI